MNEKKRSKKCGFLTFEKNTIFFGYLEKENKIIVNFGYNFKNLKILVGFVKEPTKKEHDDFLGSYSILSRN
jgi:hypothetical protein